MKKYINAQLQIVSLSNDIVTASYIGVGNKQVTDPSQIQTPGRRSIWD